MLKIVNPKKFSALIFIIFLTLLIVGGVFFWQKKRADRKSENQRQVYEALVNIVDQKIENPVEDARSSLKMGDVIVYFPTGHNWSDSEKNSYLIIKILLNEGEAKKLLQAKTKEIKNNGDDLDGKEMGPKVETVLARQYRLNLPKFDVQKIWRYQEQPFADKIFSASVIEKK